MWLMYGERTNKEVTFVGFVQSEAQLRTIGEAITKSPQWNDIWFVPVNDLHVLDAAKNYTFHYFLSHTEFDRKARVDPLVQALFEEQPDEQP